MITCKFSTPSRQLQQCYQHIHKTNESHSPPTSLSNQYILYTLFVYIKPLLTNEVRNEQMHIPQYKFICTPPVVALLKFSSSSVLCISVYLFTCMNLLRIVYFYARLHLHVTLFVCLCQMFTSIHSFQEFLTGYTFVIGSCILRFRTWCVLVCCVIANFIIFVFVPQSRT